MSEERIAELARLARLRLEPAEAASLAIDFRRILEFVAQLQELDIGSCEPLASINELDTVARPDAVEDCLALEEVLGGAPSANAGYIKVPKVLD